jgi:hypothetical protein
MQRSITYLPVHKAKGDIKKFFYVTHTTNKILPYTLLESFSALPLLLVPWKSE